MPAVNRIYVEDNVEHNSRFDLLCIFKLPTLLLNIVLIKLGLKTMDRQTRAHTTANMLYGSA